MDEYRIIGVMSGSSLDGLDIAYCSFGFGGKGWRYQLLACQTHALPVSLRPELKNADRLPAPDLLKLDIRYGQWIGEQILSFLDKNDAHPRLIGVHGHTVFHQPEARVSLQIGSGACIARQTGLPVVDNFRMGDILRGGQGAPLVPVGEHFLFPGYPGFVNLGGIANVSVHAQKIVAWDVAPCNQVLDHFAGLLGAPYDKSGALAKKGTLNQRWYDRIASLEFFHLAPPKSLSNQWTAHILQGALPEPHDALRTYVHFLADRISADLRKYLPAGSQVLCTGGGAYNDFMMSEITRATGGHLEVLMPDASLIEYKEAVIFGFLALLRSLNQVNVFASVTGASRDSVSGTLHTPV